MTQRSVPLMVVAILFTLWGSSAQAQYGGGGVVIPNGGPTSGVFHPGLPLDPGTNRAYVDYVMTVTVPGQYQIDLVSSDASAYDPYLYLFQNGVQIATNDGGGYPNSRVSRFFSPGIYVVRVSSFRRGSVGPAPFTLTASRR